MTVTAHASRVQYTGTGLAATLDTGFAFRSASDVRVTSTEISSGNETPLAKDTHYTLDDGNGVKMDVEPITPETTFPDTVRWTIERIEPAENNDDLDNTTSIASETHEILHDRIAMFEQRVLAELDKCVKFPDGELLATENVLGNKVDRASLSLGFDSNGEFSLDAKDTTTVTSDAATIYIPASQMMPATASGVTTYVEIDDVMGGCIEFTDAGPGVVAMVPYNSYWGSTAGTITGVTMFQGCADATATTPGSVALELDTASLTFAQSTTGRGTVSNVSYTASILLKNVSYPVTPDLTGETLTYSSSFGSLFYIQRTPADAADTIAGKWRLYGVQLTYTPD